MNRTPIHFESTENQAKQNSFPTPSRTARKPSRTDSHVEGTGLGIWLAFLAMLLFLVRCRVAAPSLETMLHLLYGT